MWQPPHENTKLKIPRTRLALWRKVVFWLTGLLFFSACIYGIWHLTRLPALTIAEITVVGGETISHEQIKEVVDTQLIGTYYRLIPKRFVWMYPEDTIKAALSRIPRVKQAAIERTDTTLAVAFEEYQPFALWCTDVNDTACLFIDRFGLAFAHAPVLQGGAFMRYIEYNRAPVLFETVFTPEYVRDTNAFVEALYDSLQLSIHALVRDDDSITYFVSGGGEIRTTQAFSLEATLQNLMTIFESEEFAHLKPGNFDYVDLRYGNKVFVHEGMEEVATSTEAIEVTQE